MFKIAKKKGENQVSYGIPKFSSYNAMGKVILDGKRGLHVACIIPELRVMFLASTGFSLNMLHDTENYSL